MARVPLARSFVAALLVTLVSDVALARPIPGRGSDTFESEMDVVLVIGASQEIIHLEGPTTIYRNDPVPGTDPDPCTVELEIVSMQLTGDSPFGPIVVTNRSDLSSAGMGTTTTPVCEHPTDVYFDVFVEVTVGILSEPLINESPVRVQANNVLKFPPIFDTHTHPPPAIPLVFASNPGVTVASIGGSSTHTPVQRVTFSIDDTRASTSIDPADLLNLGNPPPAEIPKENIGLGTNDNVDALSYGVDVIDVPVAMTVFFSVDPSAVGRPNTGVNRESLAGEQEGDEFVTNNANNTNIEVLDEEGIVLLPPNPTGDDLDALTNQAPSFVDTDGNMIPDNPIFFSLESGSPTLGTLGASEGDILVYDGGLGIFATAVEMGLQSGDELDALCLMKTNLPSSMVVPGAGGPSSVNVGNALNDFALISLAPGSPTLTALGASPADLLLTNFNGAWLQFPFPPIRYILANEIGLEDSDNLNALKCAAMSTVYGMRDESLAGHGAKTAGFGTVSVGSGGSDGDPDIDPILPGNPGYFPFWFTINAFKNQYDFHGPIFLPAPYVLNPPADATVLDYTTIEWRNFPGDACPEPHLHDLPNMGNAEYAAVFNIDSHVDPDPPVCGHGELVKGVGADFFEIDIADDPLTVMGKIAAAILANGRLQDLGVSATVHVYSPFGAIAPGGGSGAGPAPDPQVLLIVSGTGRTLIDITIDGAEGLTLTGPDESFPVPLVAPEPGAGVLGVVALGLLAGLRRRGRSG